MSKSIIEQAVETLNKYRNQNYNSDNKDEVELANAINVILPNYVRQEKLLELYKELIKYMDLTIGLPYISMLKYEEINNKIKELENNENI